MNWEIIKENRKAIQFLLIFVGLYFTLNTVYGLYIQHYYPTSDPFTRMVSRQVVAFLSLFDSSVTPYYSKFNGYIAIANSLENMINVYEGCNGLNVMIVYISFLTAFHGPFRLFVWFAVGGSIGIHLMNIGRVALLYGLEFYFPEQAYFFHKYLFTGIIYIIVFLLWYFWVKKVRNE